MALEARCLTQQNIRFRVFLFLVFERRMPHKLNRSIWPSGVHLTSHQFPKKLLFALTIAVGLCGYELELEAKKPKHQHGIHTHGQARLDLSFDLNKGTLYFKSDMDAILGFEHVPSTHSEKTKLLKTQEFFKFKINEVLILPSVWRCQTTNQKADIVAAESEEHGGHFEFVVESSIQCKEKIEKGEIKIILLKKFPSLHEINFNLITNHDQIHKEIHEAEFKLEISQK